MSTIIGLDHGSRRIGVAIGDTETSLAFARPAVLRRGTRRDVVTIAALAQAERAELVVVGLPLNMDGSEGAQSAAARAFGTSLAERGIVIAFCDERLSSWEAAEHLREAGRQPTRAGGELDSAAARLILQQYLDTRRRAEPPEEPA